MKKKAPAQKPQYKLTPQQDIEARKDFELIERIAAAALRGGASASDVAKLKATRLVQLAETLERNKTDPKLLADAEIGRKVRGSRDGVQNDLADRNAKILACACSMLLEGGKARGMAGRIRNELNCIESERHINRILDEYMPLILKE